MLLRAWLRSAWLVPLVTAAFAMLFASTGSTMPEAPPDGFAGNPPDHFDCTICHNSYDVNSGDGAMQILGVPAEFVPGTTYDLQVRIQDPGQIEWGFELAVLGAANEQAGMLVIVDPSQTQLSDNPGTSADFIKQTLEGTHEGTLDGPVTWSFRWVAPEAASVTFYVACNAADGTGDPGLDYIYAQQVEVRAATVAVQTSTWTQVKTLYARR
jgi:hypothetical protein